MSLANRLKNRIIELKSPIVVGLDPNLEKFPKAFVENFIQDGTLTEKSVGDCILSFNKHIIDVIKDLVPAVKPQIAFYEQYGIDGLKAYKATCDYASENGLIVIGDVKRGDIGSTSRAYSNAYLGQTTYSEDQKSAFYSDYVTVNPYLGEDCLNEFLSDIKTYDKGMFVLVKTSNPSSAQLQDLVCIDGKTIYEKTAEMVNEISAKIVDSNTYSPIGAVVGATYPSEMKLLREKMPNIYFLVPGYGAQGGGAKDVVDAFNKDGLGAIVNSSRGILYAYEKSTLTFDQAAREATIEMRESINSALEAEGKKYW
ncbi:MAG: orotidine 5'-phosphate decarboxylase [Clostridiales bacterium 38-18]|nr:MAG: orotidine 5'-phosphate decarboxylase [Clostridiales bacterium 38-18]